VSGAASAEPRDDDLDGVPEARIEARRGLSFAWLVPLVALAASAWLGYRAWQSRGPVIAIRAPEGYGIRPGHALRYLGIEVGRVEEVELSRDLTEVLIEVVLEPGARDLARSGSRFWIVRPHVGLDGVTGLETVFGARYVAVLPGPTDAPIQLAFDALAEPPILTDATESGLEILLRSSTRAGLEPGAPLTYRGIEVGKVLSIGLASDATAVEARAFVRAPYVHLVREDTRFWTASGLSFRAGLGGLDFELESIRTLLVGGVALATPPGDAEPVAMGHAFVLAGEPEPEWLEWQASLQVGTALLPSRAPTARPQHATLRWTTERFFISRDRERTAWLLPVDDHLLGPAELLAPPEREDADEDVVFRLEVAGLELVLRDEPRWAERGIAALDGRLAGVVPWPGDWVRTPEGPEDSVVLGDPTARPRPLSAARLELDVDEDGEPTGLWRVDSAVALDASWHGAGVFARVDGRLIGLLLWRESRAVVAPLPTRD